MLFFVERPTLTSDAKVALAPINFPEVLLCKIDGYDKERVYYVFIPRPRAKKGQTFAEENIINELFL